MLRVGCSTINIDVVSGFVELSGVACVVSPVIDIAPVVSRSGDLQFGFFNTRVKFDRTHRNGA